MLERSALLWTFRTQLANKTVNIYIENNNALTRYVGGDSNADLIDAAIA